MISEDGDELKEKLCTTLHENEEDACAEGLRLGIEEARRMMIKREGFDPGET